MRYGMSHTILLFSKLMHPCDTTFTIRCIDVVIYVSVGKDWKKMQPLIKTRSLVQIRTHAQKVCGVCMCCVW